MCSTKIFQEVGLIEGSSTLFFFFGHDIDTERYGNMPKKLNKCYFWMFFEHQFFYVLKTLF